MLLFQPCEHLALFFSLSNALSCAFTSRFVLGMLRLAESSPWATPPCTSCSPREFTIGSHHLHSLAHDLLLLAGTRAVLLHYQLSSIIYRIQLKRSVPTRTDHKKVSYKCAFQEEESFLRFNVCLRKRRACFYPHLPGEHWTACLNYA